MTSRIARQSKAFDTAMMYCRVYGLNWREHIVPKKENNEIIGFYVLDETKSTTVATVML